MFSRLILAATSPLSLRTPEARLSWQVLLAAAAAVMTVTLACIVPFAAMATLASRTLSRRAAILTLLAAVLANQAVGFVVLNYPRTLESVLWGPVFALATLAAFAVSDLIRRNVPALIAGFAAYQGVLAAYTFANSRSLADFTPSIVGQVALGNLIGLAILSAVYCAVVAIERTADQRHAGATR
jgi:hypothetical protein